MGLKQVLVIKASRSDSYHIFKAPAAPAPNETNKIPIIASLVETRFGAVSKPTAQVNITKDITLGFINLNNSEKLNKSSCDKLLFFNFKLMIKSKLKNRNLSQEDAFNLSELFKLMKPRVMSLVIFTCAVGLLMAPNIIPTKDAIIGIILVSIGAGAAGALNMWYESDLDALMTRTCLRPIPTGKVNKNQALVFGISLSIFSVIALDFFSNRISAALLLFTILFYVFVYTIWLKRKTPQNIVIGGAAGALPPVIGWTIATNSLSLEPITFFLIIFFWTPSHFWALSLYKSDDYKKAKIPMLPLTDGVESTKLNIFVYSILMLPVVILPYAIGFVSLVFLIPSLVLTIYYNYLCFELYKFKKNKFDAKKAKTIFGYSILYLFLIFVLFLIDKIL